MANPRNEMANPQVVAESQLDWEFLKSLVDVRDVVWPMTPRKAAYLATYGVVAGGVLAAQFTTGFGNALVAATRAYVIPLTVFAYAYDTVDMGIMMGFTKYPPLPEQPPRPIDTETQTPIIFEENKEIAVIIATHYGADVIGDTVKAWLEVVNPEQIYVVDNAKEETPPDNTQEILHAINPRIHYLYHPRPNKEVAHVIGMKMAQAKGAKIVVPIDNDTRPRPPRNFKIEKELFDDTVKVIAYPIRAVGENGPTTLTGWIDNEFARSDMEKKFEDRFHGVLYQHGAIYACEIEFALEAYFYHTTHFVSQDMQLGLIKEALGKRARLGKYYFDTLSPTTYLGKEPNKWTQRRIWNSGPNAMLGEVIEATVTQWPLWPPYDTPALKYQQFKFIYKVFMDWFRPFFIAACASDPWFWGRLGLIVLLKTGVNLFFNFIHLRDRRDLQQPFSIVATKFIDDIIEGVFTFFSNIRYLLIYLPNKKTLPSITELEEIGEFDHIMEKLDPGPHQFLTYVKVPTPVYFGLGRILGNWETVRTPVYTNTLNKIEKTLDKALSDLRKQEINSKNATQYVVLSFGSLMLAMLIAKVILNNPKEKTYSQSEMALFFVIPIVAVFGLLLAYGLNKAALTAKQFYREIPINREYLSLFRKDAEAFTTIKENPTLVRRIAKKS